jgi:hypothetical protein
MRRTNPWMLFGNICAAILVVAITTCTTNRATPIAAGGVRTISPTAQPAFETLPPQPPSPTILPTALPSETPQPTLTPIPLSSSGPWIICSAEYNSPPVVCNKDGSGCQPLYDPVETWSHTSFAHVASPVGGYLAMLPLEGVNNPQILIRQLPTQKTIRRISLLSAHLGKTLPSDMTFRETPEFYFSITDQHNVK